MRARAHVEDRPSGGERLIVTEIPFMVNKSRLVEQIAQLVRDRRIEDISDLRDESSARDGIRVVIDLKRDSIPEIVLNKLYKHTQMQSTFGVIMLALVGGVPRVMDLKTILAHFIEHRHTVVVRRTEFSLRVAREREHILEGLKIAVDNIDEVVRIIRASKNTEEAASNLKERFGLSDKQAEAILAMRLSRLTGLEIEKLEEELAEVRATIEELEALMASRDSRMEVIREELVELAARFGDDRRSQIIDAEISFNPEDLIADEPMVITITHQGYIKRIAPATYRQQRRGGHQGGGLGRAPVPRLDARLSVRVHGAGPGLLAQGARDSSRLPYLPRQTRGEPPRHLEGREDRFHPSSA
jgi:DNA gyrase subunit A